LSVVPMLSLPCAILKRLRAAKHKKVTDRKPAND
jgi:hypothetical protein